MRQAEPDPAGAGAGVYGPPEACYGWAPMASRPPSNRDDSEVVGQPAVDPAGEARGSQNVTGSPSASPAMAYAVHTRTCSYLLDDSGVCRWIVAKQGAVPPHVNQCVGAQFVACLDLAAQGGLVGSLRPGAMGLFVRNSEPGRMVLLRTAPIESVDGLAPSRPGHAPPPAFGDRAAQEGTQYGKRGGVPVQGPRPSFVAVQSWGAEQTVTVATSLSAPPSDEGEK